MHDIPQLLSPMMMVCEYTLVTKTTPRWVDEKVFAYFVQRLSGISYRGRTLSPIHQRMSELDGDGLSAGRTCSPWPRRRSLTRQVVSRPPVSVSPESIWVCQPFWGQGRRKPDTTGSRLLDDRRHHPWKQLLRIGESRSEGCSRRRRVRERGDRSFPTLLDLAYIVLFFCAHIVSHLLQRQRSLEVNWNLDICFPLPWIRLSKFGSKYCRNCLIWEPASAMHCQIGLLCGRRNKDWPSPTILHIGGCWRDMGRSSRGAHGSKLDWSKHERAWADLLHKEIFETGRYFRKTEVNQFKSKPKNFVGKKNRESPEEDEGYEVGLVESNLGSTVSI